MCPSSSPCRICMGMKVGVQTDGRTPVLTAALFTLAKGGTAQVSMAR